MALPGGKGLSLMWIPTHGGGGSSIVKVPGDVLLTRVYLFGLLAQPRVYFLAILVEFSYAFWRVWWKKCQNLVIPVKPIFLTFWSRECENFASFV